MTATMRAVTRKGDRPAVHVTDRPVPALLEPSDVLVQVIATGICGTDRAIALGEFPAVTDVVLGHESVGRVTATGPAVAGIASGSGS